MDDACLCTCHDNSQWPDRCDDCGHGIITIERDHGDRWGIWPIVLVLLALAAIAEAIVAVLQR